MTLKNAFFFKRWRPALFGLFLFSARVAVTQDTLYFDNKFNPAADRSHAVYREIRVFDSTDVKRCTVTTSLVEGGVLSVVRYSDYQEAIRDGLSSFYYANGKPCLESQYLNGNQEGDERSYYLNGQLKSNTFRKGGRLGFGNYYHADGTAKTEVTWDEVMLKDLIQPARFTGDPNVPEAYVRRILRFPRAELRDGQPELAILTFVVEKNGSIREVKIVTPTPSPVLNKEALRAVSTMSKWEPQKVNGVPERYRILFPVLFE